MGYASGLIGILSMLALAYVFSVDRRAIKLDTIAWGVGLQFLFAVVVLRVPLGQDVVQMLGDGITWVLNFSFEGSKLVFGNLGKLPVHPPEDLSFAFQVLPNIIFASALIAIFHYYGLIRALIRVIAKLMVRTFHASGAESLNVAATIFIGQTEAPLTIRSYLPDLTRSEVMTGYDQWHGPRLRWNFGGLHHLRDRSKASPQRRHHDRARFDSDGQDAGAGD